MIINGIEINVYQTPYADILGKNYKWEAVQASQDGDEDAIVAYGETAEESAQNLLITLGKD